MQINIVRHTANTRVCDLQSSSTSNLLFLFFGKKKKGLKSDCLSNIHKKNLFFSLENTELRPCMKVRTVRHTYTVSGIFFIDETADETFTIF